MSIVSIREFAKLLKTSESNIRYHIKKGTIQKTTQVIEKVGISTAEAIKILHYKKHTRYENQLKTATHMLKKRAEKRKLRTAPFIFEKKHT